MCWFNAFYVWLQEDSYTMIFVCSENFCIMCQSDGFNMCLQEDSHSMILSFFRKFLLGFYLLKFLTDDIWCYEYILLSLDFSKCPVMETSSV
jgi:hypothetical protein